jgi:hypothetical protein
VRRRLESKPSQMFSGFSNRMYRRGEVVRAWRERERREKREEARVLSRFRERKLVREILLTILRGGRYPNRGGKEDEHETWCQRDDRRRLGGGGFLLRR